MAFVLIVLGIVLAVLGYSLLGFLLLVIGLVLLFVPLR